VTPPLGTRGPALAASTIPPLSVQSCGTREREREREAQRRGTWTERTAAAACVDRSCIDDAPPPTPPRPHFCQPERFYPRQLAFFVCKNCGKFFKRNPLGSPRRTADFCLISRPRLRTGFRGELGHQRSAVKQTPFFMDNSLQLFFH